MPETQVAQPQTGTPDAQVEFDVSNYVDKSGNLKDGFVDAFVPEDMRHDSVYKKVADLKGVFRQLGSLDRAVGKKGVIIPDSKTATPSDMDAFHRALGRPEKAEDYKLEFPDEFKDFYDQESVKQFREFSFQHGFNQQQAADIMAMKMDMDKRDIEWMRQDEEKEKQDAEAALREKWGTAYETRLHLANYMISNNTEGEQKQKILDRIGNDPFVADFLANIAKKFVDSGAITDVEAGGGMTPADANAKMMEKIAEHQQHSKWRNDNPAGYAREEREIDELARMAAS